MAEDQQFHIFLDLDGVLADFQRHAEQQNKISSDGKIKREELDYNWWVTIPSCEGAREFYDAVQKMGIVKFLTGPMLNEECFSGKARWVQNFVPEKGKFILHDLIICSSKDKAYLARAQHILVDDRAENIRAWEEARNAARATIRWKFTVADARKKFQYGTELS